MAKEKGRRSALSCLPGEGSASGGTEFMTRLDRWAAAQPDKPNRSEAIRRLVEIGQKVK